MRVVECLVSQQNTERKLYRLGVPFLASLPWIRWKRSAHENIVGVDGSAPWPWTSSAGRSDNCPSVPVASVTLIIHAGTTGCETNAGNNERRNQFVIVDESFVWIAKRYSRYIDCNSSSMFHFSDTIIQSETDRQFSRKLTLSQRTIMGNSSRR